MSFLAASDLQTLIEGELKVPANSLVTTVPAWGPVIAQANTEAYADIQQAFLSRGFSAAQLVGWDNGATYQGKIGVYKALCMGAGLHGYDDKFIDRYKPPDGFLDDVLLVRGGTI